MLNERGRTRAEPRESEEESTGCARETCPIWQPYFQDLCTPPPRVSAESLTRRLPCNMPNAAPDGVKHRPV